MIVDNRDRYIAFALRVLAIFVGLAAVTALLGIGVRAWAPSFDLQTLQAIAGHRDATITAIAGIVTQAGSFALLAPLSIAFLALVVIAAGSAALPSLVKLIVARPRPTIEHLSNLVTLSFPSEHTTQAAAVYMTIAIMLSKGLNRGWRELVVVVAILIALAVAWSRVYLGVHYPTDVVAGLLLGWGWALMVFHWARPKLAGIAPTLPSPRGGGK
jgi:undecaprenyl-diphosphatase